MSDRWEFDYDDESQVELDPATMDSVFHMGTLRLGARAGNGFREPPAAQREQVQEMCATAIYGIHDLYELLSGTLVAVRSDDADQAIELVDTWEVMEDSDAQNHMRTLTPVFEAFQEYEVGMAREWYLGRRIGEPLPQAIKTLLIASLNAGMDSPLTDAEVSSSIARFEKVVQLYSYVMWIHAGNGILHFTGKDGVGIEVIGASELCPKDQVKYQQERVAHGFVSFVSEDDVALSSVEGGLPPVVVPLDESDSDGEEQDSTSPILAALACGLAATQESQPPSEEDLAELTGFLESGSCIYVVSDILSGERIPVRSEHPEIHFEVIPLDEVLSEEGAALYREAFKDATETFNIAAQQWHPQWMVGRELRRPFPPETRQYLETALRAGFDPPASDDEVREIVDGMEQDFQDFSEVCWVAGGNGIVRRTRDGLVFGSADELSPDERARYRQERLALGLITAISEDDVAEALRTGVLPDIELR